MLTNASTWSSTQVGPPLPYISPEASTHLKLSTAGEKRAIVSQEVPLDERMKGFVLQVLER